MKWYRTEDSETAGGNPTQWFTSSGVYYLVAYIRCSGPGDEETPRRVCGLEANPRAAEAEARTALLSLDRNYQIVTRTEAGVTRPTQYASVRGAAATEE